jgi:ribulose-bisphosphate carboxylase small chain
MWDLPMFDVRDSAGVMFEINKCRATFTGTHYIRVTAFDSSHGCESVKLSFIASRPSSEPGFALTRTEGPGRSLGYQTRSYATDEAEGNRYRMINLRT